MSALSILAFSGSTRRDSFNQRLVREAAKGVETGGLTVSLISLRDYPMPLFDQDLEAELGQPESLKELKQLMLSHQGLLLACPEYNSSISGVLKNTIDWLSRKKPDEAPLVCFKGKVVSLMSASPGKLGGLRGLVHIRSILSNVGCIVLPEQIAIPDAHNVFDENGQIKDQSLRQNVLGLGEKHAHMVTKLYG
ncbi:MAG: NAD(P)H-dependent oxidoreductase [Methylococcaceae bacterium]